MKIYNKNTNQFQELYVKAIDNLPIGTILEYSGSTAPNGFLLCQGQAIPRAEYRELFAIIGTQYGSGDGSTTFNLPDYRGKVGVGLDSSDTDFDTLGETGGEKKHTLTIDEMPSHTHEIKKAGTAGGDGSGLAYSSTATTNSAGVLNTGNSQAHNNLQPYTVVNFIIKAKKTVVIDTSDVIQETDTASTDNVYSASAVDNLKQDKIKFMTKQLTTDTYGNISLNMSSDNYRILNVVPEGNSINGWVTTYCFNNIYYIHTGNFNGTALSGTATFRITYIEL